MITYHLCIIVHIPTILVWQNSTLGKINVQIQVVVFQKKWRNLADQRQENILGYKKSTLDSEIY